MTGLAGCKGKPVVIRTLILFGPFPAFFSGLIDFGQVSGSITRTFTIENVGTEDLEITNILLMDGDPDYTLDLVTTAFIISPSGSTTFDVTFNPQGGGIRWKNLVINNNDPDETPYNIRLEGDLDD